MVCAAVINEDELVADVHLPERGAELLVELLQGLLFIIERNEHADIRPLLLGALRLVLLSRLSLLSLLILAP